jgi:uncharacterized protein
MRDDLWIEELEDQRREKDEAFRHDPGSPIPPGERRAFKGLVYYAPDPRYRIETKLVAEPHQDLNIQRSAGDVVLYTRLGHFALHLPDGDVKLALYESEGHSFLPFRDKTSGKDTYGAGPLPGTHRARPGPLLAGLQPRVQSLLRLQRGVLVPVPAH